MVWHCCKRLRERIKSYDATDWGLFVLVVALAGLVLSVTYLVVHEERQNWAGLEYILPVRILDEAGTVPQVEGLPAPSFDDTSREIPARLTSTIDCVNNDCPAGLLPALVTVRWTRLEADGVRQLESYTVLEDFETNLVEGVNYFRGEVTSYTSQLNPFVFPEEGRDWAARDGRDVSVWRIEGDVVPLVGDADPIAWQTEVIHINHADDEGAS